MRISLLTPLLLAVATGCSSFPTDYDYDPEFPFASLKTYGWRKSTSEQVMDPFVVKYVKAAVHRDLTARGFVQTGDPDFVVTLRDEFEDRLEVDERSGAFRKDLDARSLQSDDLILQMINPKTDKVIWRGVAADVIDRRSSSEDRREQIEGGVKALLQDFPPPP